MGVGMKEGASNNFFIKSFEPTLNRSHDHVDFLFDALFSPSFIPTPIYHIQVSAFYLCFQFYLWQFTDRLHQWLWRLPTPPPTHWGNGTKQIPARTRDASASWVLGSFFFSFFFVLLTIITVSPPVLEPWRPHHHHQRAGGQQQRMDARMWNRERGTRDADASRVLGTFLFY